MGKRCPQVRKLASRELRVVFDRKANAQVRARRNVDEVPLRDGPFKKSSVFPIVRRNKKIQKMMCMEQAETSAYIKAKLVTSTRGSLFDAAGTYARDVLEVLRCPHRFVYKTAKTVKGVRVWNVVKQDSASVIMQSDLTKNELEVMLSEIESDIGVIKESVQQLLAQKAHDVMAINTHPGHHAGPARIAGFCAINHIAVAVGLIKRRRPHAKIGVIDIDVHPGDGTEQFLQQRRYLFDKYISIHSSVKFCNLASDLGTHGIALKLDRKKEVSAQRLLGKVEEVLNCWDCARLDIVIVALGFDTLKEDKAAKLGFQMLPEHFDCVGRIFAKRSEQILFIQEGGYNLNETADAFEQLVKGFREGRKRCDARE